MKFLRETFWWLLNVWGFSSQSRIFSLISLPVKGFKFWPLLAALMATEHFEGSLACHTYCDTGHPFIMVIDEDPWNSRLLLSVQRWSCHYLILWLRSVAAGTGTPNLPLASWTLKQFYERVLISVIRWICS